MNYTTLEERVISKFWHFFNYRNAEAEISDNAGVFSADEMSEVTGIDIKALRGVLSSLRKKGLLTHGKLGREEIFRFTEKGINEYYKVK